MRRGEIINAFRETIENDNGRSPKAVAVEINVALTTDPRCAGGHKKLQFDLANHCWLQIVKRPWCNCKITIQCFYVEVEDVSWVSV